jgi:mRNA-degrading endonuclease RelE of RelBE toxin-antitoxin system
MKFIDIVITDRFEKELKQLQKKYPSITDDFDSLYKKLQENPRLGTKIGEDLYKIRLAIASKNKGKSGGARVITFLYTAKEKLLLLGIYDKSEREVLKDSEIKARFKEILWAL